MKTKDISPLHDFMNFPVNLNRQIHESIHLLNLNYMYIYDFYLLQTNSGYKNRLIITAHIDIEDIPSSILRRWPHKYSCIHAYYIPGCTDMCENYASIMTRIYIDPCLSQFIITFDQTGRVISLSIPPCSRLQQNSQQT